jgi:hypothetical protein
MIKRMICVDNSYWNPVRSELVIGKVYNIEVVDCESSETLCKRVVEL